MYLRRGSKGPLVLALQTKLTSLGFGVGTIDGAYGPKTEAAVRAYQKSRGLSADGVVGPKTTDALRKETFAAPRSL